MFLGHDYLDQQHSMKDNQVRLRMPLLMKLV